MLCDALQGKEMLTKVVEARERLLGVPHIATGEARYTLVSNLNIVSV
jgi:hypothetical protein